jgi:hypothetical protein
MAIGPACTYWLPSHNNLRRRQANAQMWLANQPLSAITPISVQQYRPHLAYYLVSSAHHIHLIQWITTHPSSALTTTSPDPSTPTNIDSFQASYLNLVPNAGSAIPSLFDLTNLSTTTTKRLRPRKPTVLLRQPTTSSTRIRHHFQINDPASMHTYAAESTLPNAGWGLFADRLVS